MPIHYYYVVALAENLVKSQEFVRIFDNDRGLEEFIADFLVARVYIWKQIIQSYKHLFLSQLIDIARRGYPQIRCELWLFYIPEIEAKKIIRGSLVQLPELFRCKNEVCIVLSISFGADVGGQGEVGTVDGEMVHVF